MVHKKNGLHSQQLLLGFLPAAAVPDLTAKNLRLWKSQGRHHRGLNGSQLGSKSTASWRPRVGKSHSSPTGTKGEAPDFQIRFSVTLREAFTDGLGQQRHGGQCICNTSSLPVGSRFHKHTRFTHTLLSFPAHCREDISKLFCL